MPRAQRATEAFFLGKDNRLHELAVVDDFGIYIAHQLDDLGEVLAQERAFDTLLVPMHDGAAQQTTQYVTAALVRRQNTVGDHERHRAAMVSHDAQAQIDIGLLRRKRTRNHIAIVLLASQALAHAHEAAQHIGFVVGLHTLHDGGCALKSQAGIDVLGGKRRQRTVLLSIKLGKHAVPVLEETIAVATGCTIRAAATELWTLVVVQLGAGTAWAGGASAPEVVVFAQTADVGLLDAKRLPNLDGLVVVFEHSEVQLLDWKLQDIGGILQCPGAHLLLEVLAETEIAHHFEEAQVASCGANDIDIVGTHALLHGRGTDVIGIEFFDVQKIRLELNHARTREQKRRIIGNQRRRRQALAAFLLEEAQVTLADLRSSHIMHGVTSLVVFHSVLF